MKRASYRAGVEWVALNDDTATNNVERIAGYITTALLADLFGKDREVVAWDIYRIRQDERIARNLGRAP